MEDGKFSFLKWDFSEALYPMCTVNQHLKGLVYQKTQLLGEIMSLVWHCHCLNIFKRPLLDLISTDHLWNIGKSVPQNYSYRTGSFVPASSFVLIFSAALLHLRVSHHSKACWHCLGGEIFVEDTQWMPKGIMTVGPNWRQRQKATLPRVYLEQAA